MLELYVSKRQAASFQYHSIHELTNVVLKSYLNHNHAITSNHILAMNTNVQQNQHKCSIRINHLYIIHPSPPKVTMAAVKTDKISSHQVFVVVLLS